MKISSIFPTLYSSTKVEAEGVIASQQLDGAPAVQTHGPARDKILFPLYNSCNDARAALIQKIPTISLVRENQ